MTPNAMTAEPAATHPPEASVERDGASARWHASLGFAARQRIDASAGWTGFLDLGLAFGKRVGSFTERRVAYARPANTWAQACLLLGLVYDYLLSRNSALDATITKALDELVSPDSGLRKPAAHQDVALHGYVMLRLAEARIPGASRDAAIHQIARFVLDDHARLADGCLPYTRTGAVILVDTLGLVCPFLALYGKVSGSPRATDLAVHQLTSFIANNVDPDTKLPFHGYRPGSACRLGQHGWGRGVGWYLMGLVDTVIALDVSHPRRAELIRQGEMAANTLARFQRPDGHWSWTVVMPDAHLDASATAFCGYALARAIKAGLLDQSFTPMVGRALQALKRVTRRDGVIDFSSGECGGLGDYSHAFRPEVWLQGIGLAFAAVWEAPGEL